MAGRKGRDDEAVNETLTRVRGIGRWAAEVYLLLGMAGHIGSGHNSDTGGGLSTQEPVSPIPVRHVR